MKEESFRQRIWILITLNKIISLISLKISWLCMHASRNLFGAKNAEDFSVDNGVLTQTLKLVRCNVMKKYGEKLSAFYNE